MAELGWFYWLIVLLSMLGAICGWLGFHTEPGIATGIVGGLITAFIVGLNRRRGLVRYVFSDAFDYFYSETSVPVDASRYLDVQLWKNQETSEWLRLGLTDQEWRDLTKAMHEHQAFSTDVIDRTVYGKVKERFLLAQLIEPKGAGYRLTRDGKNFAKYLGATLPYPYDDVPELVQKLVE